MSTTTLTTEQSFRNLPRRRFSEQEKHQIVREFLHLGIPLARFARERNLHYNQLSRWRKEYLAGKFGPVHPRAGLYPSICRAIYKNIYPKLARAPIAAAHGSVWEKTSAKC